RRAPVAGCRPRPAAARAAAGRPAAAMAGGQRREAACARLQRPHRVPARARRATRSPSPSSSRRLRMTISALGSATPAAASNRLTLEDFMKVLLTQLTYQDPLKPMDNQQFMAQIAQFTTL